MSQLVDPTEIEQKVGVRRHATDHWGRAVSAERQVYVLHSIECRDSGIDLRECPYSLALDSGIDVGWWRGFEDRPMRLAITPGYPPRLVPVGAVPDV